MAQKVRFIRKNGRIIPIMQKTQTVKQGALVGASIAAIPALKQVKAKEVTPHFGLAAASVGASVASGIVSGLTFFRPGLKSFLGGTGASIGLDAVSTAANVASYAGKGNFKGRAKGIAKLEATNILVGNAVFAGTLLAHGPSRRKIFEGAAKLAKFLGRRVI